ncbi:MAG TPA: DUF2946 family protein [Methylocystis sp.]|nr:DUF2946 family protein [Methylocystis sp.]
MPRWRKAFLLATLVLALVIGGGQGALRARASSGGPGLDAASNCLLHKGKAPSEGQSGHRDCALCPYCAAAELATPLAPAPRLAVGAAPFKASFARTRATFARFSATGGNKARASPRFL